MDRGPLACTDAERRLARELAARLRAAGRTVHVRTLWVRPAWQLALGACAVAGVAGSGVSVSAPVAGVAVCGAALLLAAAELGPLPLVRRLTPARATQVVHAPAPAPRAVALLVAAATDRPRDGLLRRTRVPAPHAWVLGALLLVTAGAAARVAGAEGAALGAAQLAPTIVLLLAAFALLDAGVAPPADRAALEAAVALAADPGAEIVLAGAGAARAAGLRAHLRADRRPAGAVVVVALEPGAPGWWTTHPQLRALADGTGLARARLAPPPAGQRPALVLRGDAAALRAAARAVAAGLPSND